ncbi:hypothetical protein CHCC5026_1748 [Bacillus licheniformis]|nr:hypothetical protein CHCC5026_1748 [Bacillus licheniformis]
MQKNNIKIARYLHFQKNKICTENIAENQFPKKHYDMPENDYCQK